jgi:hypothetical protein
MRELSKVRTWHVAVSDAFQTNEHAPSAQNAGSLSFGRSIVHVRPIHVAHGDMSLWVTRRPSEAGLTWGRLARRVVPEGPRAQSAASVSGGATTRGSSGDRTRCLDRSQARD